MESVAVVDTMPLLGKEARRLKRMCRDVDADTAFFIDKLQRFLATGEQLKLRPETVFLRVVSFRCSALFVQFSIHGRQSSFIHLTEERTLFHHPQEWSI